MNWSLNIALIGACTASMMACEPPASPTVPQDGPIKVELRNIDGRYQLFRGGQPYYIHGAGLERQPPGAGSIADLAAHGANSLRTWRADEAGRTGQEILDEAHQHGLTVTMGLEIARERPGQGVGYFNFDYSDSASVAAQLERVSKEILKYKDHPALLIWGIGNELNLDSKNPMVWDAVNQISEFIHEVDPNHLTTTMLAGISKETVNDIEERAPDLDLVSIQMYGDLPNLQTRINDAGYDGPYMVTEWGATGHWEVATAPWGAPIENTSSVKADSYQERYELAIAADSLRCLGSYVFLWGQKQERTPTWYGIFLDSGEETEVVDVMHGIWNGELPENRSPRLESVTLDGKSAYDGIRLDAGRSYQASAAVSDPDGDVITYRWEIKLETTDLGHGGDQESVPASIGNAIDPVDGTQVTLTAPPDPGAYRLFVYGYDGQGHAAHANLPFFVNE
jgi:hypothetical protein